MEPRVYLDNNATTRVADEVRSAMEPYYSEWFGNPHSIHALGRAAHQGVENARNEVALLVGCNPADVIFTSCGSEANAIALRGLVEASPSRRKIITTAVEHPSVLALLESLERRGEITLGVVPVDGEGTIDLEALEWAVDEETLLVSVMLAQNETGVLHPVEKISSIARGSGALVHVDAIQAAGKIAVNREALGADFLTLSGHKFHAPKGVGALVYRRDVALAPLWYGGGQEVGLRSGTEAVPSIVGLGVAAQMARKHIAENANVQALRDRLESAIVSGGGATVNGGSRARLPNTTSIAFAGGDVTDVVLALDGEGIEVSGGAACTSGKTEPTATMKAMGRPASVRFSLSRYTTGEEIERTIAAVRNIRSLSS